MTDEFFCSTIRFSVEDTGIGIKEEDKEKLIKHFGKIDNP